MNHARTGTEAHRATRHPLPHFPSATATEFVIAIAAAILESPDDGLPRSPTRSWIADDEVGELAGQIEPLLTSLPNDVTMQIEAEFAALTR